MNFKQDCPFDLWHDIVFLFPTHQTKSGRPMAVCWYIAWAACHGRPPWSLPTSWSTWKCHRMKPIGKRVILCRQDLTKQEYTACHGKQLWGRLLFDQLVVGLISICMFLKLWTLSWQHTLFPIHLLKERLGYLLNFLRVWFFIFD